MIGADGSAAQLADLDRRNLFVVALDSRRRWYRYHPLFAELLRSRLDAEEPATAVELHGRAAAWLARDGQIAEAIGHAIAAGDQHATAELVAGHWLTFFNQGWLMTVGRWLDALPRELLATEPQLWLARAWTLMDLGELDEVAAWLEAGAGGRRMGRRRCARCACSSSATSAAPRGPQAPPWRPTTSADSFWRTVAAVVTGVAAHWRGRYDEARPALRDAARIAAEEGNALARQYVLGYLALDAVEHDGPQAGLALLARAPGASSGSASTSPP